MERKNTKLFNKDFTLVVVGQIISTFGNGILRFALPLYLLKVTGSAFIFSTVSAVAFIPMCILAIVGGILADRLNKRNIMVLLDFITAIVILVFYFTYESLPIVPLLIVVLMALYGIVGLYQPTVQASVPLLASKDTILRANGVVNQVGTLSNLLSPFIGGVLYSYFGIDPILVISVICFALSSFIELFINIPFIKTSRELGIFATAKKDLIESYQFAKNEKPFFIKIALVIALFNMVTTAVIIVGIPIIVIQVLQMKEFDLGITQSVFGVGGLFGGIFSAIASQKLKIKQSYIFLFITSLCVGLMGFSLGFSFGNMTAYILITIASFILMSSATIFTILIFTMIQTETPSTLIGKIIAVMIAISLSSQPIGQAIYGWGFDYFGASNSYIILTGSSIISLFIVLYSKNIFKERR